MNLVHGIISVVPQRRAEYLLMRPLALLALSWTPVKPRSDCHHVEALESAQFHIWSEGLKLGEGCVEEKCLSS